MKPLSGQAEEQDKTGAASPRRAAGFGAEPSSAVVPGVVPGGFGRRQTPISAPSSVPTSAPIPVTTDGTPRRAAANDGGLGNVASEKSFGLPAAHDQARAHAVPRATDDLQGDLSTDLLRWLQNELRRGKSIQHESVLCALGALAGYAAQQAIRETMVKTGKLALDQAFVVIETRSGEVFFFGDTLNEIIIDKHGLRGEGHASIWKIVSEGGYEAGAINLPDVTDTIKHCAATVGREEFGLPRVPAAHMPEMLPHDAVSRFWPAVRRKLAGTEPMSWPVQLAMAAHRLIVELKGAIRPDIAVQLVMEAAVPMSKIDPVTLPKE